MDLRRGPDKGNKDVVDVWTRFLPVAIEKPYNRVGLAFDYAERLRAEKKFQEAAAYYARVPDNDPRHLSAKYLQMVSLYSLLLEQPASEQRNPLAAEVLRLADQSKKLASEAMKSSTDDADDGWALAFRLGRSPDRRSPTAVVLIFPMRFISFVERLNKRSTVGCREDGGNSGFRLPSPVF